MRYALVLIVMAAGACASTTSNSNIRGDTDLQSALEQVNASQDGWQDDGSIIKCVNRLKMVEDQQQVESAVHIAELMALGEISSRARVQVDTNPNGVSGSTRSFQSGTRVIDVGMGENWGCVRVMPGEVIGF